MKKSPSVDVVIAACNEAADIAHCLKSLHGQLYPGLVQIYVALDQRCRDATGDIAAALGATVLPAGRGAAQVRNQACRKGSGELLAFLDAHCFAQPNWLQTLVKSLQKTGAAGVEGRIVYRYSHPPHHEESEILNRSNGKSAYAWLKTGNCLYRRQAWQEAGGFDTSLWSCEDVDLSWRILLAGQPLAFCPQAIVTHLDRRPPWQRLRQSFHYGVGAGQLAHRFGLSPPPLALSWRSLSYGLGAFIGKSLLRAGPAASTRLPATYPWTPWHPGIQLRPATGTFWWYCQEEVVVVRAQQRIGTQALLWRGLSRGWSRQRMIDAISRAGQAPAPVVALDLDDWVERLLHEGWLESQISSGE